MELVFTIDQLKEAARQCWQAIGQPAVVAFHGEMGAGKTTFIHALCEVKGVKDVVGSPTFSIINEYSYSENGLIHPLYHMDLYRLKDEAEAIQAGVEDCLYSGHSCFVEWPERAPGIFPENTLHLYIKALDSVTRRLTIADK
jgi:tRNA threonylcarbamoyladenosine biosynthesis protein TsaE